MIINHTNTANTSFSFDLNASDVGVGVDTFTLNDTNVFNITREGIIRNATNLSLIKIYFLTSTVNDTLGNSITSSQFFINITEAIELVIIITNFTINDMILGYNTDLIDTDNFDILMGYNYEF